MLRHLPATKMKRAQEKQSGFALLLLVFFIALMLITAMAAAPRILTEAKRQKEREMIWRGNQYVRGVKLYYRKMGRFPTSIDDLTKPKTGSLRFMRQAYKDPMNTGDGSWRLIYVGPAGQLIGSLKPPKTLQIPGAGPGLGASASSVATNSTQSGGTSAFGSSSLGLPYLAAERERILNPAASRMARRLIRRAAGKTPGRILASRELLRMELGRRERTRTEILSLEMRRRRRKLPRRRKRLRLSAEILLA